MIPCTRLYAYIGCQLRAAALAAPAVIRARGPYASWIKEYSSDEFLALPAMKEALLEELGAAVSYGNHSPSTTGLDGPVPDRSRVEQCHLVHLPVKLPTSPAEILSGLCIPNPFCHNGRALLRHGAAVCQVGAAHRPLILQKSKQNVAADVGDRLRLTSNMQPVIRHAGFADSRSQSLHRASRQS